MQIARDEGRGTPSADDRARAREELQTPNGAPLDPEVAPELGGDRTSADEAPGESGRKIPNIIFDDEESIGKELVEKGMKGPVAASLSDDQRRK